MEMQKAQHITHNEEETPFFSIIVPVYNVAPYLRECLDSVLAQTYSDWECLCVDDGSTDESGAILDEYAQKDKRFRVFHKENGGVSSARNLALDNASGEWIGFLDGDDVWSPLICHYVNNVVQSYSDVDVVRYGIKSFLETDKCRWDYKDQSLIKIEKENISSSITSRHLTSFFWSMMYSRKKILDVRFKPYVLGEDLLFLTESILKMKIYAILDVICYGYRQRLSSVTHTALTYPKVYDSLKYSVDILKIYDKNNNRISLELKRLMVNKVVEGFFVNYRRLKGDACLMLWKEWCKDLRYIYTLRILSKFQKVRIWLLLTISSRWVANVLCYFPHCLKEKGFHRWFRG